MILNEKNLRAGVLKHLVNPVVEIDTYTPKIQSDSIVVVVRVDGSFDAGYDFSSFVEKLPFGILDTEVQEVPNTDGFYEIFIEIERNEESPLNICRILKDSSSLCSEGDTPFEWKFTYYGQEDEEPILLDESSLRKVIRTIPEESLKEFMEYSVDPLLVNQGHYVVGGNVFNKVQSISDTQAAQLLEGAEPMADVLGKYYELYDTNCGMMVINNETQKIMLFK